MATLVQTTPATRHPPQPYQIVRPSSSSSAQHTQRPQPLFLVSATPQVYVPPQSAPPYIAVNYDYTRQTHQAQQQVKQGQFQQRRQATTTQSPRPHSRPQETIQSRSRSDGALRERSHLQSQIQSSAVKPTSIPETRSAAQLQGPASRPGTSLPLPPPIKAAQPRPSSADGSRPSSSRIEGYRGKGLPDQRPRYVSAPAPQRDSIGVYLPPPAVPGGYGLQPRYSADDVTALKYMGYQNVQLKQSFQPYSVQPHPIHNPYQGQPQYGPSQYNNRPATAQPVPYHSQLPHPRVQHSPKPSPQSSPSGVQQSPKPPQTRPQQSSQSPIARPPQTIPTSQTKSRPSPQPPVVRPMAIQATPAKSHSSPQTPRSKPQQPPKSQPSPKVPQQTPASPVISSRQSSLPTRSRNQPPRVSRVMSPPLQTPGVKRASSSPEFAPPRMISHHRKTSSSSTVASAASAPPQLETVTLVSPASSTEPPIPPPPSPSTPPSVPPPPPPPSLTEQQHAPHVPSPLGKSTEIEPPATEPPEPEPEPEPVSPTPQPPPETKNRSFSSRLRRALAFTGTSTLSTSISSPDLHASAAPQPPAEGGDNSDRVSISSTASSASVMLRKMSQGFRRSRKSIIGIFKGATTRRKKEAEEEQNEEEQEDKFPFGVPGEEASVGVSYATAEGELSKERDESRKSMVFGDRETQTPTVKKSGKSKKKSTDPTNIRGILKNSDSRQSSFDGVAPNSSTDSISSIKANLVSDSPTKPSPASDFAKSLASTLDSQLTQLVANPPAPPSESGSMSEKADSESNSALPPALRHAATAPATPTGRATPRRGIQFSPRLEVHETWHSTDYDRRGEPATCNRLTAQLAQMIKEELNAFKMEEMIVHEDSRSYTHFF